MLQLARMRLEAQRLFEEWKGADIEEKRRADLLASGACDNGNDAAVAPGTVFGKTSLAEARLGGFTGAWEECSAEKGVHIITDTTLRWSSVATSDLVMYMCFLVPSFSLVECISSSYSTQLVQESTRHAACCKIDPNCFKSLFIKQQQGKNVQDEKMHTCTLWQRS